jgi:hypothetical protein
MMCEKNIDKKIMEKKTDKAAEQRIWKKGFLAVLFSAGILTGCQMEKAANPKEHTEMSAEEFAEKSTAAGDGLLQETSQKIADELLQETSQETADELLQEFSEEIPEGQREISAEKRTLEGMEPYGTIAFSHGEENWELGLYVQEDMVEDGELMLDDSCHFVIQAETEEGAYVLLDEKIQLGVPEADVWMDTDNRLHITVRDTRTALYEICDYVYQEETRVFTERVILEEEGINYLGTV